MQTSFWKTLSRITFMLLIGAVASVGNAADEKPLLPSILTFEYGAHLYQIDYSDYLQARTGFAEEGGCYEIRLTQRAGNEIPGEDLPALDDLGSVFFLAEGVDENESVDETRTTLFTRTTCMDAGGVRIVDEAGTDRFEMEWPWRSLKEDPMDGVGEESITVRINGITEVLDSTTVDSLVAAQLSRSQPSWLERRPEFLVIADGFDSLQLYGQMLQLFQEVQFRAAGQFRLPPLGGALPQKCWKPCTMCAINAGGTLVGGTVLAASCATSFGATCVGGAVGIVRMAAGTFASCDDCLECRRRGGSGGDKGGSEGGGEGNSCSEGYHECCDGQCCSDENPPEEC